MVALEQALPLALTLTSAVVVAVGVALTALVEQVLMAAVTEAALVALQLQPQTPAVVVEVSLASSHPSPG